MSRSQVYFDPAHAGLQAPSAIDFNPSVVCRVLVRLTIQTDTVIHPVRLSVQVCPVSVIFDSFEPVLTAPRSVSEHPAHPSLTVSYHRSR